MNQRPLGTWHQKSFYQIHNGDRIELQGLGVSLESVRRAAAKGEQRSTHAEGGKVRNRITSFGVQRRISHQEKDTTLEVSGYRGKHRQQN